MIVESLMSRRESEIYKRDDVVVRPLNHWSKTIHLLLSHYQRKGIGGCPQFVAIENGQQEILTFVDGDSYNYPLRGAIASETALISAAKLLRRLHDASSDFIEQHPTENFIWMLAEREPKEVICHGDFTPYNVALNGNEVIGTFDFDTAHPAPRVWDLAYSIYCWAPFKTDPVDRLGDLDQQIGRARLFCDAYGATLQQRTDLVETMIERLNALIQFMQIEADSGNHQFAAHIEQGHHLSYLCDIDNLRLHRGKISEGLRFE